MMEKTMTSYETVFIVNNTLGEEAVKDIVSKFVSLIEENGEIENVNEWGNRRLAYPIQDLTEGYYVLVNYKSGPEFPAELQRVFNITDGILRSMTVKSVD